MCFMMMKMLLMIIYLFVEWLTDERILSLIPSQDQYQKFWPLKTSDTSGAGFELCTETKFESTTNPSAKFHGGLFS